MTDMKKEKLQSPGHPIPERLGVVGGQAVTEGVMMKHGDDYSLAVRKEDGTLEVSNHVHTSIRKKNKLLNLPILRGIVNMVEMFSLSFKTLSMSAEALGIDDTEPESKFEEWLMKKCGKYLFSIVMTVAMVLGVGLVFLLFLYLPALAVKGLQWLVGVKFPTIVYSLIEGLLKMGIFISYLAAVSLMKEIRRTFEYHGAEHKTIFCFEDGVELTPENVKKYTRFHPRCGTSFIFVVLIVSILINALPFIPTDIAWLRVLCKLALVPLIVGIGYEFIRFAGKHDNAFTRILSAPGLWVQRLTTKEPDESQIAVAIAALKCAMPDTFPGYPGEGDDIVIVSRGEQGKGTAAEETKNDGSSERKEESNDAEASKEVAADATDGTASGSDAANEEGREA